MVAHTPSLSYFLLTVTHLFRLLLSFALDTFKKYRQPLVVFGHSLGESDNHLVSAIQQWANVPIAVSMRPDDAIAVRRKKAVMRAKFPAAELYFFDSTTHPIGAENLRIRSIEFSDFNLFAASQRLPTPERVEVAG